MPFLKGIGLEWCFTAPRRDLKEEVRDSLGSQDGCDKLNSPPGVCRSNEKSRPGDHCSDLLYGRPGVNDADDMGEAVFSNGSCRKAINACFNFWAECSVLSAAAVVAGTEGATSKERLV